MILSRELIWKWRQAQNPRLQISEAEEDILRSRFKSWSTSRFNNVYVWPSLMKICADSHVTFGFYFCTNHTHSFAVILDTQITVSVLIFNVQSRNKFIAFAIFYYYYLFFQLLSLVFGRLVPLFFFTFGSATVQWLSVSIWVQLWTNCKVLKWYQHPQTHRLNLTVLSVGSAVVTTLIHTIQN